MRVTPRSRPRDDGFTLVELLLVIVILAVIIAPLTAAVVVYLRNTGQTTDRMAQSHDVQIAAVWFTQDVQNIGIRDWTNKDAGFPPLPSIETNAPATGGAFRCGPPGTPTAVVRFAWDDPAAGGPVRLRVAYVITSTGEERQLRRLTCDEDGDITSELVVAHHLDPTTNPAVACRDIAGTTVPCTGLPLPATVELTLTLRAATSDDPYTITLSAQRRQT